jgi:RNA polymerase sigma factor (sigma-70 family)
MHVNEIIAGCKDGSARHFDKLYETYSYKLYGICKRYSRDAEEAKDILQEGFIKVFMQLKTFDERKGSFDGWLKKIFVHQAVDYYRKKLQAVNFVSSDDVAEEPHDDAELSCDLSQEELLELVRELPAGYRMVFNLFVMEEMSHKEIAEQLGITVSTSKSQFYKARKLLQEKIKQVMSKHQIQ